MTLIAVAALSARMMAEAAARDGFEVIALDLFGDADTRLASSEWRSLGTPGSLQIDEARTLAALRELTRRGDVRGWVAGSGFEGRPELLDKAASLLPLVGTSPEAVARVRDPLAFFGFLAAQGIAHPPVRCGAEAQARVGDETGWLVKDAHGCGGWHIHHATPTRIEAMSAHHYLQRQVPGVPMSATFVGNGDSAVVVGFNELIVREAGAQPFVFCGAVGPVPLPPDVAAQVGRAVQALTREFRLRGLCSLDFMLHDGVASVLEVNPRPPASMALYGGAHLMSAHVRACQEGTLRAGLAADDNMVVEGTEIVFARRAGVIDDRAAQQLVTWPDCHDLPCAGTNFNAGDPVCSLSASGRSAAEVKRLLNDGREALLQSLETRP